MRRIAPLSDEALRVALGELERAEQTGDEPRSESILGTLFREYLGPRLRDTRAQLSGLDLDLLDRKAVRSLRKGRHVEALVDYQVGIDEATRAKDPSRALRARLGAASVQLVLVDLVAAEAHVVAAEATPGAPLEVTVMRARLEAARGRFARADATLSEALAQAGEERSERTREWALLLAEIRIDRGDFVGFEALRKAQYGKNEVLDGRWSMLGGTVLAAQGRLTAALGCFRRVLDEMDARSDSEVEYAARWHALQALIVLNRLDEAEDELARLCAIGGARYDPRGEHLLAAWLASRRGAGSDERAANEPFDMRGLACCLPGGAVVGLRQVRSRWRERLSEECAYLTTFTLLHLQDGDLKGALGFVEWLGQRMHAIESPLLQARYAFSVALTAHGGEEWELAAQAAAVASTAYRALGMPIQEWGALRVLVWCAAHGCTSEVGELASLQARGNEILARIVGGLDARDGAFFRLSKWSADDERRARVCRACARGELDAVEALQQVVDTRLWEAFSGAPQVEPDERSIELATRDVYALARHQCALWGKAPVLPRRMTRVAPSRLPRDTAIAHYVVLPDRIELFVVTHSGVRRVALRPTSKVELWPCLRGALRFLKHQAWRADARVLVDLSERLGAGELHGLPAAIRRLYVIPDGALAGAPFGALIAGGEPLLARFILATAPRWSWTTRPQKACKIQRELGVAVETSSAESEEVYTRLPGVAEALRTLPPVQGQRTALSGANAQLASVVRALADTELALFLCHGKFDPDQPGRSGVLLADAWLTLELLSTIRLQRLQLAVLAACEVGDSVPLPGAEALGLPSALLLRGAAAVAMPLWAVPPGETVAFAAELFAALGRHDPAEALACTRRRWFASKRDSRVWAAFEVHANGIAASWWGRFRLRLPW